METFNESLTKWQPFFTAVAGATATLIGLLFVSLSINREKITAQEDRVLLRLAQRSFADFLFAMFIALMFLIPCLEPRSLAIPLFCVAAMRGFWLARSICRSSGSGKLREQILPVLSTLALFVTCYQIYRAQILVTFLLVPIIAMLVLNASRNAWALLIMEKNLEEKPTDQT